MCTFGPMDADRCRFLFGSDVVPVDVDDDDEMIGFFERELAGAGRGRVGPLACVDAARRGPSGAHGRTPATWATAQRLVAAGMDRSLVLNELTMAAMVEVQRCPGGRWRRVRRGPVCGLAGRAAVADRRRIDAAIDHVASTRPGIPVVDLEDAVVFALGRGDDDLAASLVARVIDAPSTTTAGCCCWPRTGWCTCRR